MAEWKYEIDIKQYLNRPDLSLEEAAYGIIEQFHKVSEFLDDPEPLEDALTELKDAGQAEDQEWFNAVLDVLYDIADEKRIWCGL